MAEFEPKRQRARLIQAGIKRAASKPLVSRTGFSNEHGRLRTLNIEPTAGKSRMSEKTGRPGSGNSAAVAA